MSIKKVILFYSDYSAHCKEAVLLIKRSNVPIALISVDSEAVRNIVSNGELVKIVSVPTLMVAKEDGNLQLYIGAEKVFSIVKSFVNRFLPINGSSHTPQSSHDRFDKNAGQNDFLNHFEENYDGSLNKALPETPIELIFDDTPYEEITDMGNPVEFGLSTGPVASPKPNNSSVKDLAKKMRAERENTLGYQPDK